MAGRVIQMPWQQSWQIAVLFVARRVRLSIVTRAQRALAVSSMDCRPDQMRRSTGRFHHSARDARFGASNLVAFHSGNPIRAKCRPFR